jgi:hypothetical protein
MRRSHLAGFPVKMAAHRGFEGIVIRGLAATLGLTIALAPAVALAQVNIDQDKSPAQIYAGDCAACHKSIRGLANGRSEGSLAGFLSEHYTASAKEASAVAAYVLSSGGAVGRAGPARGQPDGEGARASAEPPKSREARRPERPDEKPAAGASRRPELERRAAVEPGSARGPVPDRRGPAATRTRGRAKPAESAKPVEPAKPIEAAAPASPAPAPEAKTAVAAPAAAETPSPQANPAEGAQPVAAAPAQPAEAAPPPQPAETAPVLRDNIPD